MAIYFTYEEMTKSTTAKMYGLANLPESTEITENLKKTMYILDINDIVTGKQIGRAHV